MKNIQYILTALCSFAPCFPAHRQNLENPQYAQTLHPNHIPESIVLPQAEKQCACILTTAHYQEANYLYRLFIKRFGSYPYPAVHVLFQKIAAHLTALATKNSV